MMIDVVLTGTAGEFPWQHGRVLRPASCTPSGLHDLLHRETHGSTADGVLFWDPSLGRPDAHLVHALLGGAGDVWHAGLRLGTGGLPRMLDFVTPTWPLNRDPDPDIEATSWRISMRACLVRTSALRAIGHLDPEFRSLAAAGLEWGHRLLERGAFVRHVPSIARDVSEPAITIPLDDELRFIRARFGGKWALWSVARHVLNTPATVGPLAAAAWSVRGDTKRRMRASFRSHGCGGAAPGAPIVSVIVPTVDRYPYLRVLLDQLRSQTVPPYQVIVVDQSPVQRRDAALAADFPDLPITVLTQDSPGQCTSRNAALKMATGDYILLLDDDVEVEPTLIEEHLRTLHAYDAASCSGVAHELGAGALPESYSFLRLSNVFPAGNTMVRREALAASGLFDLAYNRAQKADGDLGMRLYLSGAVMVLDPSISVLHHHAPSGGLRVHKSRTVTYASSRQSITQRHLPSVSEIYLAMRYFSPRQVREMLWHRTAGTFSARGGFARRVVKVVLSGVRLPLTVWEIRRRRAQAAAMLRNYPQIPTLERELQEA